MFVSIHMERSVDHFMESLLFLHLYVIFRNELRSSRCAESSLPAQSSHWPSNGIHDGQNDFCEHICVASGYCVFKEAGVSDL